MTYDLSQLPDRMVAEVIESAQLDGDHELANLWFQLAEPHFDPLAIVPVPSLRAEAGFQLARRLATAGAAITHEAVLLVATIGLDPANAEHAEAAMAHLYDEFRSVILVTDSPTVNAASIPILNACARVALAVGMNASKRPQVDAISRALISDNVIGAICLEPRGRNRRRGRKAPVGAGHSRH